MANPTNSANSSNSSRPIFLDEIYSGEAPPYQYPTLSMADLVAQQETALRWAERWGVYSYPSREHPAPKPPFSQEQWNNYNSYAPQQQRVQAVATPYTPSSQHQDDGYSHPSLEQQRIQELALASLNQQAAKPPADSKDNS
jgi:hypothetical protein